MGRGTASAVVPADLDPIRRAVVRRLLPWFRRHRRPLPWRRNRTPYRVLVAEIMLQQTRVEQAIPYYERFLRRFPTWTALAKADEAEVLKAWEGLGYYARARNLHRLARWVIEQNRGRLPRRAEELSRLPGLGPYTAAAVASLAFGEPVAAIDGNGRRVLARWFALAMPRGSKLDQRALELAAGVLPHRQAAVFNEALMDLGATICRPRRPRCNECPMRSVCRAATEGRPEVYPARAPIRPKPHLVVGAAVTLNGQGRILIARRKSDGFLGGLWEFPGGKRHDGETLPECIRRELQEELAIDVEVGAPLTVVHHEYSHFTVDLHVYFARRRAGRPRAVHCADFAWVPRARLRDRPFARADLHVIEALEALTPEQWRQLRAWAAESTLHPSNRETMPSRTV